MNKIRIGILIRDRCFAGCLADKLSEMSRNMDFVVLDPSCDVPHGCEIILADDQMMEAADLMGCSVIVRLSYDEFVNRSGSTGDFFIYSECRDYLKMLSYVYYEHFGRVLELRDDRSFDLIMFMSLEGGAGTTSLAISTARFLNAMYGDRCLYVNLKSVDDSVRYLPATGNIDRSRLLYHMGFDRDFPLFPFINTDDGIDYLSQDGFCPHASEMSLDMFVRLLSAVSEEGRYDYVIADTGTEISSEVIGMCGLADASVLVSRRSSIGNLSYQLCEDKLLGCIDEERLIKVSNFDDSGTEGRHAVSNEPRAFVNMGGRTYIELNSSYGIDAAELAKKLTVICNG